MAPTPPSDTRRTAANTTHRIFMDKLCARENCAVTPTQRRNYQNVSSLRINLSDSEFDAKCRWNFSTRESCATPTHRISQCDDRALVKALANAYNPLVQAT